MWSFKHLIQYVFILCLPLAGCGFQPLHMADNQSNHYKTAVRSNNIEITNIPNRSGQYLRNILIDELMVDGYPENPRYKLKFSPLIENITQLGVRRDASSTRAQMRISTEMTLVDKHSGQVVLQRSLRATNSFNILASQYSTRVSEQYARERALDEIAKQIVTQISLLSHRGDLK